MLFRRLISLRWLKRYLIQNSLSYLHSEKIVHRDVKTENLLLDTQKNVKIADFGVARVEAWNPCDMTGETGTLGYMAPEVLNGKHYNRKCDVYSFGICLWEIYCCDMPYPDLSFVEISSAVVQEKLRPAIPRCCLSSLVNIMRKCWGESEQSTRNERGSENAGSCEYKQRGIDDTRRSFTKLLLSCFLWLINMWVLGVFVCCFHTFFF
ncbi:protein tesmin/TSO1-like CXC 2-like [Hibiscus syriacus]|uniref:Protein tesmin/TSO1-like CXC 2-like n=1 Tax=Hibiscus syriacus TaxID=106335 RepID=A0A6A3BCH6_HIBSY|nr:protein tesmin/TSO1-like CXC 2-like [Hibiscus syriacus]